MGFFASPHVAVTLPPQLVDVETIQIWIGHRLIWTKVGGVIDFQFSWTLTSVEAGEFLAVDGVLA